MYINLCTFLTILFYLNKINLDIKHLFFVKGKIDRYELIRAFQELGIEIDNAEAIKLLKR